MFKTVIFTVKSTERKKAICACGEPAKNRCVGKEDCGFHCDRHVHGFYMHVGTQLYSFKICELCHFKALTQHEMYSKNECADIKN